MVAVDIEHPEEPGAEYTHLGASVSVPVPDQRHILYAGDFDPLARSGQITHESGRIETLIDRNRRIIADATLMAAGFDPFLERVSKALTACEVDAGRLIAETFGPQP